MIMSGRTACSCTFYHVVVFVHVIIDLLSRRGCNFVAVTHRLSRHGSHVLVVISSMSSSRCRCVCRQCSRSSCHVVVVAF